MTSNSGGLLQQQAPPGLVTVKSDEDEVLFSAPDELLTHETARRKLHDATAARTSTVPQVDPWAEAAMSLKSQQFGAPASSARRTLKRHSSGESESVREQPVKQKEVLAARRQSCAG